MHLALNCWFSQCYNTRILTAKLSPYYLTYLLFNLRFRREQWQNLLQTVRLFISECDERCDAMASDNSWTRHRWSFEAFELEITVNYPVHTWMENGSFMRNLTSWSVPFWLVLLTEHKVHHCYALNAVCRCVVAGRIRLSDSLQQIVDDFQVSDPCRAIHSTAILHHTALTDRDF